jgi:Tol biopolymer transport system component
MRSELVIYSLETGMVRQVLQTDLHIEAPNWSRDGKYLVINGAGHLFRVDLETPVMAAIDTGFATRCNNDHGISPDGGMLVISNSAEVTESRIYTLPTGGGTPFLVQGASPSYWHGWSPDGRTLAYTAKRGGAFQIYTCPVGGGTEMQITFDFDHCDGPDYTPDGQWIWFNGEKAGSVQLWRVRPDGTNVEQMTRDERVNWFPHPSPDRRHVLYLAYETGTKGHPANRTVELRLIPASGGAPRTLISLMGGQGTINVPCWSPGSGEFAFVRYSPDPPA